jgi:phospholipid/cholesterol/gamma-HCH transport system ATP-binding protein
LDLRTESLNIRFEGVAVVDAVSLTFPAGCRVLLMGNAAAGKTTLLKSLAGLCAPTAGTVRWGEEDAYGLSRDERRVRQASFGMVFQTDALFDSLSVLDNVLLPLTNRKVPKAEGLERARAALDQVGLSDAAAKFPERLSGGMRRRAGIARAIVARPHVLIADDPLAGLDPHTGAQVSELLLRVSAGCTLLVAATEPPPGLSAPRWVWIESGRVAHDGSPNASLLEAGAA